MEQRCIYLGSLRADFPGIRGYERSRRFYSPYGLCPCLVHVAGGGQEVKVAEGFKENCDMDQSVRVRKLTPRECYRLMGFDDDDFDRASAVCSETNLYKQAGNSIVVNVLEGIMANLKPYFRKD